MRPLKILMLNHNPKGAGTYFRCFHFARQLVQRGHDVTLVTCGSNRLRSVTESLDGVRVISTPRLRRVADWIVPGGLDTGFLDILARIGHIAISSYDVIHGFDHLPSVSFPSYFARRVKRACFVSDWCDWWTRGGFPFERFGGSKFRNRLETNLEEGIRRVAHGVTTISTVLQERALGLGIPAEKVKLIPSGADIESIRPLDQAAARDALHLPRDARILGFVGFVDTDVDLVLTALRQVRQRIPQAKALIVGGREFAATTAQVLGIEDAVILAGIKPYDELPAFYAACDVLALPLRDTLFNRARWPNKIGDYLAAGRPTVTNPVGDVQELFRRHEIGLLARENDAEDFALQVTRLLEDRDLARHMGHEARRLAEEEYSWAAMTDHLEAFYFDTLAAHQVRVCHAVS
jgi:glycosyltransferase involved in cell wall biosynthesis